MSHKPRTTLPAFVPVPRLKERSNGWNPEVQRAFIEALADTGSVRAACRSVGRSDHGAYQLRRHPEAKSFRKAWDAALDLGVRRIEDVAMDRALNGVEVPVYSYGELIGTRTVYNDYLLMFILRNRAPHRFAPGGGARGMNAIDRQEAARLKKKWRREWQAEEGEKFRARIPKIRADIDTKLDEVRERYHRRMSPQAAELEIARLAQARADEAAGWEPGMPYAPHAARAAELLPCLIEQVRREWIEEWGDPHAEPKDEPRDEPASPALLLEDRRGEE